jgi:hypothetical protein
VRILELKLFPAMLRGPVPRLLRMYDSLYCPTNFGFPGGAKLTLDLHLLAERKA